ncbi:phytoene desaturase, pro-zeta-carotene producing [hydrocarbon metagenome]|uniref:Phytoene desaturase, pro-zeta-carotene producing n=1 Tax=hydrocarbon metagenome TaxID=938273 RepID=A0A0W8FXC6_9ZZZZ
MAKCIIVGGGLAGLSAAAFLADKSHNVHLIEATPKLGGRAYSFLYSRQNSIVDNGQHIMMGCYRSTLKYFEIIGAIENIDIQKNLRINFAANDNQKYLLRAKSNFYPVNILFALLNYKALSLYERLSVIKIFSKVFYNEPEDYSHLTTKEFLIKNNQSQNAIDSLWEIIHVGTMNCKLDESSAEIFIRVLREIFFTGNQSTKIILPNLGMSETYCKPTESFLERKNCSISLSEKLIKINFDKEMNKAVSIVTNRSEYSEFDYLILAIPPFQLQKIFDDSGIKITLPAFEYSPILNIHLWLDKKSLKEKFYGLINSRIHWVFNHTDHITLVTSAADELIDLSDDEILKIIEQELVDYLDEFTKIDIKKYLIIKEKRATLKPSKQNTNERKKIINRISNIFLAGDWVNTGLPSTIEGAVRSSHILADEIS